MITEVFSKIIANISKKKEQEYLSTATTMHSQNISESEKEEIQILLKKMEGLDKDRPAKNSKSE